MASSSAGGAAVRAPSMRCGSWRRATCCRRTSGPRALRPSHHERIARHRRQDAGGSPLRPGAAGGRGAAGGAAARLRAGLALAAGAALAAAFAPLNLWPLAVLCPAVLLWLWQDATAREAARLGFCFNSATFAAGTYWLYISIHIFGGAPVWLAFILMLGLVAVMG